MSKLVLVAAGLGGLYLVATRTEVGRSLASKLLGKKPCCADCAGKATP